MRLRLSVSRFKVMRSFLGWNTLRLMSIEMQRVNSGVSTGAGATENRLSECRGRPLGLCRQRLPELDFIPVQVIDPGKAAVGFIHSFGVDLYSLLF